MQAFVQYSQDSYDVAGVALGEHKPLQTGTIKQFPLTFGQRRLGSIINEQTQTEHVFHVRHLVNGWTNDLATGKRVTYVLNFSDTYGETPEEIRLCDLQELAGRILSYDKKDLTGIIEADYDDRQYFWMHFDRIVQLVPEMFKPGQQVTFNACDSKRGKRFAEESVPEAKNIRFVNLAPCLGKIESYNAFEKSGRITSDESGGQVDFFLASLVGDRSRQSLESVLCSGCQVTYDLEKIPGKGRKGIRATNVRVLGASPGSSMEGRDQPTSDQAPPRDSSSTARLKKVVSRAN